MANGQGSKNGAACLRGSELPPKRVFFLSRRPLEPGGPLADRENIWTAARKGDSWGEPEYLGDAINSLQVHWQVSTDLEGNLYFGGQDPGGKTMGDIFVSQPDGGRFSKPEKLGPAISSADHEHSPTVAPDGSYIIFSRASQQRGPAGPFHQLQDQGRPLGGRDLPERGHRLPDGLSMHVPDARRQISLLYILGFR